EAAPGGLVAGFLGSRIEHRAATDRPEGEIGVHDLVLVQKQPLRLPVLGQVGNAETPCLAGAGQGTLPAVEHETARLRGPQPDKPFEKLRAARSHQAGDAKNLARIEVETGMSDRSAEPARNAHSFNGENGSGSPGFAARS